MLASLAKPADPDHGWVARNAPSNLNLRLRLFHHRTQRILTTPTSTHAYAPSPRSPPLSTSSKPISTPLRKQEPWQTDAMAMLNYSSKSSSNFARKTSTESSRRSNTQASAYAVNANTMALTGFHFSSTPGGQAAGWYVYAQHRQQPHAGTKYILMPNV